MHNFVFELFTLGRSLQVLSLNACQNALFCIYPNLFSILVSAGICRGRVSQSHAFLGLYGAQTVFLHERKKEA
jgi:hypothetical protein